MNPINMATIKGIMEKLRAMPTNADFTYPLADKIEGYVDKIPHPMDLGTIEKKLADNEYTNSYTWYKDVCLVYENCKAFYGPKAVYSKIAGYNMAIFKKLAVGLDRSDAASWYSLLRNTFDDLIKFAGRSPVPQGFDPFLTNLTRHAETPVPLKQHDIAETVDFLNREMEEKEEIRKDIFSIMKEMQPDIKIEDTVVIDAEKINENTRAALFLYARAHM